ANAKPLWSALPDGGLKRQILAELANRGGLGAADLVALWGGDVRPARAPRTTEWRRAHASPRRSTPGIANQLDRALWLLVQRSDLWETLDAQAHDLLAAQAA